MEEDKNSDRAKNSEKGKLFELTAKIARLADQSFAGTSQLCEIIEELCGKEKGELDIFGEDRALAIFVITQLMELIRQLPMKFFTEIENREHVLEAMQAQLDELIVLEEQEENEELGNEITEVDDSMVQMEDIVNNA